METLLRLLAQLDDETYGKLQFSLGWIDPSTLPVPEPVDGSRFVGWSFEPESGYGWVSNFRLDESDSY